jgi:carbonic anhydrase
MKPPILFLFMAITLCPAFPSCSNTPDDHPIASALLRTTVLTATEQHALTPDKVIQDLKNGNRNYREDHPTPANNTALMKETIQGQFPEAFVLSCMDSRVPVEEIFDRRIGDIFVGRVAGNVIDEDILGSMEYGCKLAGARLIVVMGHESCGAVKGAIDGEELGNLTGLLARIKPAIQQAQGMPGDHSSKNPEFVTAVVEANVRNAIRDIESKSPVLKEMADKGEIRIVGALYHLNTGEVTFLTDASANGN